MTKSVRTGRTSFRQHRWDVAFPHSHDKTGLPDPLELRLYFTLAGVQNGSSSEKVCFGANRRQILLA
jgi:hypothetical protein